MDKKKLLTEENLRRAFTLLDRSGTGNLSKMDMFL